ncbi:hypothetical protein CRYUN_Cryun08bG0091200 [Craigia yunnanensis]
MSGGYPQHPPGYGYGAPPAQPYTAAPYTAGAPPAQPYTAAPYTAGAPPSQPYTAAPYTAGAPPPHQPYGAQYAAAPYGAPSAPYSAPPGEKPPKDKHQAHGVGGAPPVHGGSYHPAGGYASPFAALLPSAFPQGTDPSVVACFQMADQDGSGFIDDNELQRALSSYNQSFSLRTVRLLMYLFTNTNTRKIGPKEFIAVFYSLQNWRAIFEKFDRDRSGKIDANELREALLSLGFAVSPVVLDLLVSKFDKTGGKNRAIEYDNFIEYDCCSPWTN